MLLPVLFRNSCAPPLVVKPNPVPDQIERGHGYLPGFFGSFPHDVSHLLRICQKLTFPGPSFAEMVGDQVEQFQFQISVSSSAIDVEIANLFQSLWCGKKRKDLEKITG